MRILLTLVLVSVLVLVAAAAGAADLRRHSDSNISFQDTPRATGVRGIAVLELSSMSVEIEQVLDQAGRTEKLLLKELATATEDEEVQRIVRRIERLEVDRELAILKIQARYARLEGRWDLDYKLRVRIMEILDKVAYAMQ